ncbi:MAG: alpha/beta hydrolase-fold protein [Caulobacteraceae bacterium]|nr:alpha/beta hydrolase-fold protein [Caulobacteraceae bacterium]
MKLKHLAIAAILLLGPGGRAAAAQTAVAQTAGDRAATAVIQAHATLPATRQFEFTSAVNGRAYRIQVSIPPTPPPPGGFPVLYVLDGDAYFGAVSELVSLRGALGREVEPAVVVGLGYPDSDNLKTVMGKRGFELTPTEPGALAAPAAPPGAQGRYGGADGFLQVIQTEVRPRIATLARVDPARGVLFGHSLGGLFVLHTMFTHPSAFQTYLAVSPSIWWNGRVVLKDEAAFGKAVTSGKAAPRLYMAVGALEQPAADHPPPGVSKADLDEAVAARMVDNARELAGRLGALQGAAGYRVEFHVLDGRTHLGAPWASLNDLIEFALPPPAR